MKRELPYIREPIFIDNIGAAYSLSCGSFMLEETQRHLVELIAVQGADLPRLAESFSSANSATPERVHAVIRKFISRLPALAILEIDLPSDVEAVIVDRGWGGVSRHALDIWAFLNQSHRTLLICAEEPPFGYDPALKDLLITPSILKVDERSHNAFISITRTILHSIEFTLLLFTHCAMAPFYFDVVMKKQTILFGDEYGERTLGIGRAIAPEPPPEHIRSKTLLELCYGAQEPWLNLAVAKAYYWSFKYAAENWFWTGVQLEEAREVVPELENKYRFVLPLFDSDHFCPATSHPSNPYVLFTTTSSRDQLESKGMRPVMDVLRAEPSLRSRMVLNYDPDLSSLSSAERDRVEVILGCPKAAMLEHYRGALANCRISKADSSPLSVMESMSCGVPTVVSPIIAKNIPIIMDGITGFIVDPEDTLRLREVLLKLSANLALRLRIGEAGRRAVLRYSFNIMSQDLLRYFGDIDADSRTEATASLASHGHD